MVTLRLVLVLLMLLPINVQLQCLYTVHNQNNYVGCFRNHGTRLLQDLIIGYQIGNGNVTNDRCILGCRDARYRYAGTESIYWCFCGNDLYRDPVMFPQLPESGCTQFCVGDPSQTCGDTYVVSVYETELISPSEPKFVQYMLKHHNTDLVSPPQDTVNIINNRSQMEFVMKCAVACRSHSTCKVFSLSTSSYECKLYTFLQMCDGLQVSQNTDIFTLL